MVVFRIKRLFIKRILVAFSFLLNGLVTFGQVQTGHYAPGWNGKLKAGIMVENPGFYMTNTTMYFHSQRFMDGEGNVANSTMTDYLLNSLAFVWRPDVKFLGGDYQVLVAPAIGNLSGRPILINGVPQNAPVGLSDIFFSPIALGWHWNNFHTSAVLSGFAPTGKYKRGSSENTGLGFWTIMPFVLSSYTFTKGAFEKVPLLFTGGVYYEIHTKQSGQDFKPGDTFTFEWNLGAQIAKKSAIGASGYFYRQVTDPKGNDVQPVDKYSSDGIGITYSQGLGSIQIDLRALKDFNVKNGPEGVLIYLDISWGWPKKDYKNKAGLNHD